MKYVYAIIPGGAIRRGFAVLYKSSRNVSYGGYSIWYNKKSVDFVLSLNEGKGE